MIQEQQSEHSQFYLSIIMPMFNGQAFIGQTLGKIIIVLGEQVNDRFEILVVDDGSSDDSAVQVFSRFFNDNYFVFVLQALIIGHFARSDTFIANPPER